MKPVSPGCSFDDLPLALRPAEVAAYLRVSPSTVYALIGAWRATNGAAGLPAYRLGANMRVPKVAVGDLLAAARRQPSEGERGSR